MTVRSLRDIQPLRSATSSQIPSRRRQQVAAGKLFLSIAPLLLILGGLSWHVLPGHGKQQRADLITHAVTYDSLQATIVESGTLQSAHNSDIVCHVKAGTAGSLIATTIKWVIDEGSPVHMGDVVVVLDDSGLQENLKAQRIAVFKAESDLRQAEENSKIVQAQNNSDLQSAGIAAQLAAIDLEKYVRGDYEQSRKDVEGRLTMAESDLEMWRDRVAWSERMLRKGFSTSTQTRSEQTHLDAAGFSLANVREELRVLQQFTHRRVLTELENTSLETRRNLLRIKNQTRAKALQARADELGKRSVYESEAKRARDIEEQIAFCTIPTPHDGIVVYANSEQSRYGSGSQQGIIAQGEPVREGQRLMQIPDLTQMLVETRVHEAQLAQVHPDEHGDRSHATTLGDPAWIHVRAFPELVLRGHVKHVSSVPSRWDWMLTDVKLYPAEVAVDELPVGLKPGMTAEVTILSDQPLEHVLTVPVEALEGRARRGQSTRCFVLTGDGPEEREVLVGSSDDSKVEIKSGLDEGDQVILNPETLHHSKADVGLTAR